MKKFMVWYIINFGYKITDVDDIVYAESKTDAIKQFIIRNKGRYNVVKIEEINNETN